MKIAFYIPTGKGSFSERLIDQLICTATGTKYAHVELHFESTNMCFSSSSRDGGVRFKEIDLTSGSWVVYDFVNVIDEEKAAKIAWQYIGQKYDWMGILGMVFPFKERYKLEQFCSGLCTLVLQELRILPDYIKPFRTSPGELFDVLSRYDVIR